MKLLTQSTKLLSLLLVSKVEMVRINEIALLSCGLG